jgi:hypothetical protein
MLATAGGRVRARSGAWERAGARASAEGEHYALSNILEVNIAGREELAGAFLIARGARTISHPGGTLYEHLLRTAARLRAWGAREDLALAGMCHATYGTDGFDRSLLPLSSRGELASVVGDAAEAIVYAYASCDRDATYRELTAGNPMLYDRFDGTFYALDATALSDFVELTFANELDVMQHSADLRARFGANLARLFAALAEWASPGARTAFDAELGALLR